MLAQASPPVLFLELHNEMTRRRGASPRDPVDYLAAQGYRLFGTDGHALTERAVLEHSLIRVCGLRSDHGWRPGPSLRRSSRTPAPSSWLTPA